jgi:hypothetical protein
MMYPWLVFLHVLGVFGFLMAHGVSASAAFALRRERNLERVRALLDLSSSSIGILHSSIMILFLTGIVIGFMGRWWGKGWIWLSFVLLIAIYVYMGVAASGFYSQVRKAVGLAYMQGFKPHPAGEPASVEDIDALLNHSRPVSLAVIGLVGLAIIAWLMMFKPF